MKTVKYALGNPFIILLVSLIVLSIIPNQHALYAFVLVFALFFISLIYMLIQKKWLKLILSFLGYIAFFILFVVFMAMSESMKPQISMGDQDFYKNEISNTLNLEIPSQLKLVAKTDTIYFIGPGGGDYNAECLYEGSKKSIAQLERKISGQKTFAKIDMLEAYPTEVLNNKNFDLLELESVYRLQEDGRYIIHVAFNKSRTKFYYKASHY
jgi:energy-coupling factor transporter transmembrane protein EcfT